MFFSSASFDLKVIIFMLCIVLVVSVFTYLISKKILATLFVLSAFSNLSIYLNSGSELFDVYRIKWIVIFTNHYWPYLNLFIFALLIFNYFKHRNVQKKKN